jgi:hypothetical protein
VLGIAAAWGPAATWPACRSSCSACSCSATSSGAWRGEAHSRLVDVLLGHAQRARPQRHDTSRARVDHCPSRCGAARDDEMTGRRAGVDRVSTLPMTDTLISQ